MKPFTTSSFDFKAVVPAFHIRVIIKEELNPLQQENLALMKSLMVKTDEECQQLLFYVMTQSEHYKHNLFLFPEEA